MYDNWEDLEQSIKDCKKCKLCTNRTNIVFGVGNKNADVMFIGEGPGADEDRLGEPFVGKAGKLMDKAFQALEIHRDKVYIANIKKHTRRRVWNNSFKRKMGRKERNTLHANLASGCITS